MHLIMKHYPIDQYLHEVKSVMLYAAKLWAEVRQSGQATVDPKSLDGDSGSGVVASQARI